jgi:S1-C subfamily serine protease
MSKKWIVGVALGATLGAGVLIGTVADVGTARAAAPGASARATAVAPGAPRAKNSHKSVAPRTLSLAATKKLASAAARVVSPALVDVRTDTATAPAAGTGIVLTSTGEVLTNFHVIAGATGISATDVGTGRTYPAVLVGHDARDDIAVLQLVGATNLPTAQLAGAAARVGQSVFAVGNAHGVGGTPAWASGSVTDAARSVVTTSADGRTSQSLTGMIATTAPIVPGFSGGALVNSAGQVVGVSTAGSFPGPDRAATAAYAIPIARAMTVVAAITAR